MNVGSSSIMVPLENGFRRRRLKGQQTLLDCFGVPPSSNEEHNEITTGIIYVPLPGLKQPAVKSEIPVEQAPV